MFTFQPYVETAPGNWEPILGGDWQAPSLAKGFPTPSWEPMADTGLRVMVDASNAEGRIVESREYLCDESRMTQVF